jgi:hypothetical protein
MNKLIQIVSVSIVATAAAVLASAFTMAIVVG